MLRSLISYMKDFEIRSFLEKQNLFVQWKFLAYFPLSLFSAFGFNFQNTILILLLIKDLQ